MRSVFAGVLSVEFSGEFAPRPLNFLIRKQGEKTVMEFVFKIVANSEDKTSLSLLLPNT